MVFLGAFLVGLGSQRGPLGPDMVDLGCLDTDGVGKNDRGFRHDFTARWALTSHFEHGQRKM